MVYLPVELDTGGELESIRMLQLDDGRVALVGYTALDRFVRCCGDGHPWMIFETRQLEELRGIKPFDVNLLDIPLPERMRVTGEERS